MDDRLVLFVATVAQISKLSTLCRLLSRIFPPTDLHKENERSFGKFSFITNKYKIWIADKDCGPWTESDRLGYATVRLTGSPIARDLAKTQHGVYREYKNRTRINSIGNDPSLRRRNDLQQSPATSKNSTTTSKTSTTTHKQSNAILNKP